MTAYTYKIIPKEKSAIHQPFFGRIINQTAGNLYFEIDHCGTLIIMPHRDIEYMYPINYKWKDMVQNNLTKEELKKEFKEEFIEV